MHVKYRIIFSYVIARMIVEVPVFMKKILVIDDMPTMLKQAVKTAGERYNVITAG